jgi:hypothetical protein
LSDEKRHPPGHDWITVVRTSGTAAFATAFSANPVLDASVLNARCVGVEPIEALFEATRAIYQTLAFTSEAVVGPRTYLEWEARLFGEEVAGSTILTRDGAGLIERVQVYHRPLHMVLRFSAELARHLNGKVDPNLFGLTEQVGSHSNDGGGEVR